MLQTFAGVPRSLLWRGGARQAAAFALFLARLKGFTPLFEMHGDTRRMSHNNPNSIPSVRNNNLRVGPGLVPSRVPAGMNRTIEKKQIIFLQVLDDNVS